MTGTGLKVRWNATGGVLARAVVSRRVPFPCRGSCCPVLAMLARLGARARDAQGCARMVPRDAVEFSSGASGAARLAHGGAVRTNRNQRSTRTALMNPCPRKKWTIGNEGNPRARIAHDRRHPPHPRIGGNSRASNAGHSATRPGGHMVCGNPFRIHMVGAAPGHSVYSGREIWLREAPGALHPRGSRHVGKGVTGVEKGREGRYPPICPSGKVEAPVRRPFVASREGMPRNNYPHV
jgi:hypothetical protein